MIKSKLTVAASILCLLGMSSQTYAQTCKPDIIAPSTNIEQFTVHKDGTVTDAATGLMWTTCTIGQRYSTDNCIGTLRPFHTWSDALLAAVEANNSNLLGYSDWRVPNIKELGSIVERSCSAPAIRLEVFKNTPRVLYWSNTPDSKVNPQLKARVIDFNEGTEFASLAQSNIYLRLVRDLKETSN